MSNQTYLYFGAYLRVITKPSMKSSGRWVCKEHNSLDYFHGRFCPECGKPLTQLPKAETYPNWFEIEQCLPKKYHEQMTELTHNNKDDRIIFLCGNTIDEGERWLYLWASKYEEIREKVVNFPSSVEIDNMVESLMANHKDLIREIKNHPYVDRIMYGCGFVENSEI